MGFVLWGSRWVHVWCPRGNHAKASDEDHRKERSGVGRHMGGVRFKKIMWSHVLSSLCFVLWAQFLPLFSLHYLSIYPQVSTRAFITLPLTARRHSCLPIHSCFSIPSLISFLSQNTTTLLQLIYQTALLTHFI